MNEKVFGDSLFPGSTLLLPQQTRKTTARYLRGYCLYRSSRTIAIARHLYRNITVYLVDGSAHDADVLAMSDNYDLALLSVRSSECPCLKVGSDEQPQLGQKVFAVGNPSGLTHTVTAGILSGYRQSGESTFIQTGVSEINGNGSRETTSAAVLAVGLL